MFEMSVGISLMVGMVLNTNKCRFYGFDFTGQSGSSMVSVWFPSESLGFCI